MCNFFSAILLLITSCTQNRINSYFIKLNTESSRLFSKDYKLNKSFLFWDKQDKHMGYCNVEFFAVSRSKHKSNRILKMSLEKWKEKLI